MRRLAVFLPQLASVHPNGGYRRRRAVSIAVSSQVPPCDVARSNAAGTQPEGRRLQGSSEASCGSWQTPVRDVLTSRSGRITKPLQQVRSWVAFSTRAGAAGEVG